MSLRHCPECGHEISTFAEKCPECGFPYEEYKKIASSHGFNIKSDKFVEMYWISKPNDNVPYIDENPERKCAECGTRLLGDITCPSCGFNYGAYRQTQKKKSDDFKKVVINVSRKYAQNTQRQQMIYCPGCQHELSVYAETCPHCAFPIRTFMVEHHITDIHKAYICPKCGDIYCGTNYEKEPLHMTCQYCGTTMLETEEDGAEMEWNKNIVDGDEFIQIANSILAKYTDAQLDPSAVTHRESIIEQKKKDEERQEQLQQQTATPESNIPRCPVCGSTDIENISTLNRAVSTAMVGIASKKIGKQFHCKNCGYDF